MKEATYSFPEFIEKKGHMYRFTGKLDWSKHYPMPIYKLVVIDSRKEINIRK